MKTGEDMALFLIEIKGTVQGVGFRPFVFRLAKQMGLSGAVKNDSSGVSILVSGTREDAERLEEGILNQAPPAASISYSRIVALDDVPGEFREVRQGRFTIVKSSSNRSPAAVIPPDLFVCSQCLEELFNPSDRRHLYPFINCTNCGPRYSIIKALPYDRPKTSMARFKMCPRCRKEYEDPLDRRFHAQPIACPECGPQIELIRQDGGREPGARALSGLIRGLREGKIAAIKGLGGFHLAVDAANTRAVALLRRRKGRRFKPFAVMIRSLEHLKDYCTSLDEETAGLMRGPESPIVLLPARMDAPVSQEVSPNIDTLGVMLPYTPLHHLMFAEKGCPDCLVMTSANFTSEPICKENEEALDRLKDIADLFLIHDRPIVTRLDDSVAMSTALGPIMVRRARGFVPRPIRARSSLEPVLAFGADLKTTICFARGEELVISQHLGDASHASTLEFLEETKMHLTRLLEFTPRLVVCDLHPDYFTARLAAEFARHSGLPLMKVQHHRAHAAAVAAEHGIPGPMAACVLDGTGWGDDGTVWGGEIFAGPSAAGLRRRARLERLRLPGGDKAAKQPWRMAISAILKASLRGYLDETEARRAIDGLGREGLETTMAAEMVKRGLNAPWSSSCGRLFDAVASILGICHENEYEAQAAMELESLASRAWEEVSSGGGYANGPIWPEPSLRMDGDTMVIASSKIIGWIVKERAAGRPVSELAAAFHGWLVQALVTALEMICLPAGISRICLSGGCFMNRILFNSLVERLRRDGHQPFWGREVPMNDGGISLGQAYLGGLALSPQASNP
jgi:hydrogenase maturation protein HypF